MNKGVATVTSHYILSDFLMGKNNYNGYSNQIVVTILRLSGFVTTDQSAVANGMGVYLERTRGMRNSTDKIFLRA